MDIIDQNKEKFEQEVKKFQESLTKIRTGRATPVLIENIMVEAYTGLRSPLKQLANINVAEARVLTVQPWDKSISKEIEKALANANLGASIKNEGALLRVIFPQLTEENRKNLVKVLKEKAEHARIALRLVRDSLKEKIKEMEENKEITEDDRYQLIEKLDKTTKEFNKKIEDITRAKEEEIMTI